MWTDVISYVDLVCWLESSTGVLNCRYAAPLITVNLVPCGAGALVCNKVGTAEVVTGEGPLSGALRDIYFTVLPVVQLCAATGVTSNAVLAAATMETGIGFALVPIHVDIPESVSFGCVFKVLPGLLIVAGLLITLSLQVPLKHLLQEERVRSLRP